MENEFYEIILKIVKTWIINFFTLFTAIKIINKKSISYSKLNIIQYLIEIVLIMIITGFEIFIESKSNRFYGIVYLIVFLTFALCKIKCVNIGYALVVNLISLGINYTLFSIAVIICGIINRFIKINNISIAILILILYVVLLIIFLLTKRVKNGFKFIQGNINDGNVDNIILNVSAIIIFFATFLANLNFTELTEISATFIAMIIITVIMFITISKSFQMYYKHRVLLKELDSEKEEINQLNKNIKDLEKENIEINKVNHTLSHKLKALEHKINKLLMDEEIAKELSIVEKNKIKENFEDISKEVYKEKAIVSLAKTEIPNIDNMLELMQEECIKNMIEFELQIIGNIFHMTNNYISKEELEILIADHVKDAIIAINHSDNEYRSILVRLGKIDNCYSLYIYDSGIEFEEETLKNLGKKPSTTHAEEGGTGLGFMNTFDTLRKHNASLIIKEISKPCKNNYTKVLMIKFDGKNNFQVKSYKTNTKIEETIKK